MKQKKLSINGREYLPLVMSDYDVVFELLDLDLNTISPLEQIPIDLMERLLTLVQNKCLDDVAEISPVDLLTTAYEYIVLHINLMKEHERTLSIEEQRRRQGQQQIAEYEANGMLEDAQEIKTQLRQEEMKGRSNSRGFYRQLKQLNEQYGEHKLHILQWCMTVSQSPITNLSVNQLMGQEWQDFIQLSNQSQILNNLQQAAQEDAQRQIELEQSKAQQPQQF